MKKVILLSAIVLFFGAASDTFGQRHNNRNDRSRIRSGVRSGQLTRAEARQLRNNQREIRQERRVYRSDGVITAAERREIRRDRRQQDRTIFRERHDNDRRDSYAGGRDHERGNGYYRRGAGSPTHPVFGNGGKRGKRH
ncbi:MAG: hypothetical protein H0U54_12040 [Acidobacteria bacterium]|nr:hypothetical protein [Acidobacteriota bacterium]